MNQLQSSWPCASLRVIQTTCRPLILPHFPRNIRLNTAKNQSHSFLHPRLQRSPFKQKSIIILNEQIKLSPSLLQLSSKQFHTKHNNNNNRHNANESNNMSSAIPGQVTNNSSGNGTPVPDSTSKPPTVCVL